MVHVADKTALYAEFMRVLRPGGLLIASDWLWKAGAEDDPLVKAWVGTNPLGFVFTTVAEAKVALQGAGFTGIALTERHKEIAARNRADTVGLEGPAFGQLAALVGEEIAQDRLRSSRARQAVLDAAALLPTHLHARKP